MTQPGNGFLEQLTNWPNLFQGGLGNLVGSLLGVIGAFLAALWTISRQRRNDREHAREMIGIEAAADVAEALRPVVREVQTVRLRSELAEETSLDMLSFLEVRELLYEYCEELARVTDRGTPLLPEELAGRLRYVYVRTSVLTSDEVLYALFSSREKLTNLEKTIEKVYGSLGRYRRDPSAELKRLRKEDRSAKKEEKRRKRREKGKRPEAAQPPAPAAEGEIDVVRAGSDDPVSTDTTSAADDRSQS